MAADTSNASAVAGAGPAIAMMLLANLLFSSVDGNVKWMLLLGVPALQLAFCRYAGHFVITLGLLGSPAALWRALTRPGWPLIALRSALLVISTMGNFIALQFLPLTITSAIMFSAPIFVCLLSGPLLGERVGPRRWAAVVLGFLGVLIVLRPFGESFHWAGVLALWNALTLALYSLMTRQLAAHVPPLVLQFWTGLLGTLAMAPLAAMVWTPPPDWWAVLVWAWLGVAAWAGHEFLTRAHRIASASLLMPFSYSFLIYLSVVDVVAFDYVPDLMDAFGIAVIILAGLLIWRSSGEGAAA